MDSPTLVRLLDDFRVTLAATSIAQDKDKDRKQSQKRRDIAVEITIYGFQVDMDAIGNILSDGDLFLQHPTEYDPGVNYINPQYLVRPGAQMAEFKDMAIAAVEKMTVSKDILDEKRTSEVLRIFDNASGPSTFGEVQPSARLRTRLQL